MPQVYHSFNFIIAQSINKPDGNIIFISLGVLILAIIIMFIFAKKNAHKSAYNTQFSRHLSVRLIKSDKKGEVKLKIKNRSKKYIEIKAPELIIKSISSTKKMAVKSNNYPLTISPGTSHSIMFNKKRLSKGNSFQLYKLKISDNYNNSIVTRYRWL